ncbi:helix-turn-helix domain-containing protein [Methylobacterium sp. 22177]|uniref:helix-turn-helix domain-containing protein n=1 Tax=Methylobacterium sp. 22177 TaxID=3453885 RepID=UPI003F86A6A5
MTPGAATHISFSDLRSRWGGAVDPGLLIVPNVLLKYQERLYLETLEVVLILNIVDYWDEDNGLPFPRLSALAKRVRKSKRTVERSIVRLSELGYLLHLPSEQLRGQTIRRFDLSGLVAKLQELSQQEPRLRLQTRLRA